MKAKEMIKELCALGPAPEVTCDTVKSGDPERELRRIAVTMFPRIETLHKAALWGADMMIVHEPTYYEHMEMGEDTPVSRQKRDLIEKSGMVLFRFHDRMHASEPDGIAEGELHYLGLSGKVEKTPYFASYIMTLDEELTARELGLLIEKRLGIKRVRIAGERNKKIGRLALCFGSPGGIFELISDERIDSMLIGEVCEWQVCEYARDAAALGINKSVIAMGHVGSERGGMRYLFEKLSASHPDIEFKYFENEEVYSYTDEP